MAPDPRPSPVASTRGLAAPTFVGYQPGINTSASLEGLQSSRNALILFRITELEAALTCRFGALSRPTVDDMARQIHRRFKLPGAILATQNTNEHALDETQKSMARERFPRRERIPPFNFEGKTALFREFVCAMGKKVGASLFVWWGAANPEQPNMAGQHLRVHLIRAGQGKCSRVE